jgi:hypothetical protein
LLGTVLRRVEEPVRRIPQDLVCSHLPPDIQCGSCASLLKALIMIAKILLSYSRLVQDTSENV